MATVEAPATLPAERAAGRREWFHVAMAGAVLLTIALGFGRSYYFRAFTDAPPLRPFVHVHAIVFTGWVLFYFAQTLLVRTDRVELHRRLGAGGAVLAGLVVILGIVTALYGARHGHNPGGPFPNAFGFLVTPLGDILLFAGFVAAGLYYRRHRETHKRLMLLAAVGGFLWPAIARLPYIGGQFLPMFGLLTLFVLAGPVHDLVTRRRVHPAYIFGGLLILGAFPIRIAIGLSETWQRFAQWLIG